ncbi:MAG: TlpA disulfide reductase family protein [Gemmatimonadota bacterium]
MSKQWLAVALIVAGLGVGGFALARFGPEVDVVETGARAPDFKAVNLATGDSVSFRSAYGNTVTMVNIWATWCLPCRMEMPTMQKLYEAFKDRGFRIAAVSIDEGSEAEVKAFAQELGLTFDILHDRSGRIQQLYQTTGVPESFIIDRKGVIVKRAIGYHDWNSPVNRALIERLLTDGRPE